MNTGTGNIIVALLAVLTTLGMYNSMILMLFLFLFLTYNSQVQLDGGTLSSSLSINVAPMDGLPIPYSDNSKLCSERCPPPTFVIADLLKLEWSWRRGTKRSTLPQVILATFFAVATITASIFSSLVVDSSDLLVLVDSPGCGWIARIKLDDTKCTTS